MTGTDSALRERPEAREEQADQGSSNGVTPHLTIPDKRATEAIAFYKTAFGATQVMPPVLAGGHHGPMNLPADDNRIMHAHLKLNGGPLMLQDDFPEFGGAEGRPAGIALHLQVDDADRWFERALAAGATEKMPLADQFWGDRYGQVSDPFGFTWSIGTRVKN
jgi:PhnB protein